MECPLVLSPRCSDAARGVHGTDIHCLRREVAQSGPRRCGGDGGVGDLCLAGRRMARLMYGVLEKEELS